LDGVHFMLHQSLRKILVKSRKHTQEKHEKSWTIFLLPAIVLWRQKHKKKQVGGELARYVNKTHI